MNGRVYIFCASEMTRIDNNQDKQHPQTMIQSLRSNNATQWLRSVHLKEGQFSFFFLFFFFLRAARNVSDPGKLRSSGYWRHKSRAEEDYQADIEGGGVGVLLKKGRCSGVVFSSIHIKRNLSNFFFSLIFV